MIPLEDARRFVLDRTPVLPPVAVPPARALGLVTAEAVTSRADGSWDKRLYRSMRTESDVQAQRATSITAIPYYAWANREPGPMRVWIGRRA